MTFPATATIVQMKLGMHHGAAFDIQAVCSGFVYAVATADSYLKNGLAKRALVIGAETFSRILDWTDRTTCVLFGDGAGAAVMELGELADDAAERGILASALRSDGHHWDKLYIDGGPSRPPARPATSTWRARKSSGTPSARSPTSSIRRSNKTGYTVDDLDWFVPHQANKRIIDGAGAKLGMPPEKVVITVDHARQYLGRLGAAGAERRRRRRPHQARRSGDARGHGRRLHLGRLAHSLVTAIARLTLCVSRR